MNTRDSTSVPTRLLDQVPLKCSEGLALAHADEHDGAIMVFSWCNRRFCQITGHENADVIGQRGTILIGQDMEQGTHLHIIDKLMNWEQFIVETATNRRDGERFWVRMSWTPLTDPDTSDRWWLCSLIEIEQRTTEKPHRYCLKRGMTDTQLFTMYSEELARLERENKRLNDLAQTVAKEAKEDPLTGLFNRRHFELNLNSWVASLRSGGPRFAVVYVDLDRFKSVNDTLGHEAGDKLLICVANMLRRLASDADLIARVGGDEFVVLKPLDESALSISGLADMIVDEMRRPFMFEGKSVSCSASVGVAIADANLISPDQVVADADAALYHSKAHGRARWSYFTTAMHQESVRTKRLASELLVACDRREFIPFFQPLVCAQTGYIHSLEVLARWIHPSGEIIEPSGFFDIAAKIGIVNRIDELMFNALRREIDFIDSSKIKIPSFSINISGPRLEDPSLIHDIKCSGIDPTRLTAEILESVYLEEISDSVQWALNELNELGVTIAVDDFGTGHASVKGLLKIKPEILKIDRQFLEHAMADETSRSLYISIMGIGQSLGMKVVAEGVETEEQARFASGLGCDFLQGFHVGRPMNSTDLRRALVETNGIFWRNMAGAKFESSPMECSERAYTPVNQ